MGALTPAPASPDPSRPGVVEHREGGQRSARGRVENPLSSIEDCSNATEQAGPANRRQLFQIQKERVLICLPTNRSS